jgi:CRP/FNR family cyclic AMP-dependent transcriptional regulator
MAKNQSREAPPFDVEKYLQTAGVARKIENYRKGQTIFTQGEPCHSVMYIQRGGVKLAITSHEGKEAVIALLNPGEFFGEGCIAGQPMRSSTAVATDSTDVLVIGKQEMIRVLHEEHEFSDRFVSYMLRRNVRVEEDLADQLFNSSEKRLARALLLVARYGKEEQPEKVVAKISQETLAEMIGTTRSRVSFFMNRFRKLGYIKYNGGLSINSSLLRVVLHD